MIYGCEMDVAGTERLIDDMAWCWWTRPRVSRVGDAIFFGALDSQGGMVAARFDLVTRAVERVRLARFEDDDHNNPALVAVPGKPLVCLYSRHDAEEGLRVRVSGGPLSLAGWSAERILAFGGSTTYAQVHALGDELHLFTRVDETRWSWRVSPDWAQSWAPHRDVLAFDTDQQVYMASALLADGRTLRVAVSGHPKDYNAKPLHDVWACLIDLEDGTISTPLGGQTIGNLRSGAGLPLDYGRLERVRQTPADRTVNLFDVSSGPVFEIGFVSKLRDDQSTRDARYHVSSLRGDRWTTEDVVAAGGKFGYIDAGFYAGGIAFPHQAAGGQLYLSREADGLWHLEAWRRAADGSWSGSDLLPPGATRIVRPWAVDHPTDTIGVVALALERYAEDSYFGSLSHLVGAPTAAAPSP